MPILNDILPVDMNPTLKTAINVIVIIHLLAVVLYFYFLIKSFTRGPQDHFREQFNEFEKKAKLDQQRKKEEINKHA